MIYFGDVANQNLEPKKAHFNNIPAAYLVHVVLVLGCILSHGVWFRTYSNSRNCKVRQWNARFRRIMFFGQNLKDRKQNSFNQMVHMLPINNVASYLKYSMGYLSFSAPKR